MHSLSLLLSPRHIDLGANIPPQRRPLSASSYLSNQTAQHGRLSERPVLRQEENRYGLVLSVR